MTNSKNQRLVYFIATSITLMAIFPTATPHFPLLKKLFKGLFGHEGETGFHYTVQGHAYDRPVVRPYPGYNTYGGGYEYGGAGGVAPVPPPRLPPSPLSPGVPVGGYVDSAAYSGGSSSSNSHHSSTTFHHHEESHHHSNHGHHQHHHHQQSTAGYVPPPYAGAGISPLIPSLYKKSSDESGPGLPTIPEDTYVPPIDLRSKASNSDNLSLISSKSAEPDYSVPIVTAGGGNQHTASDLQTLPSEPLASLNLDKSPQPARDSKYVRFPPFDRL